MNHKNKGFSLIELLASIFIVSLVIGVGIYFTINIINQSQDKSNTLTINNVKSIAKTYVEENSKEVVWYYAEEENQSKTCISLQSLINKGYLKEDILENNNISNFIIVSKDTDGNFLSETFDTNNYCLNQSTTIKIPTSKNNCNTLTYKGEEQELTKDYEDYNYTFKLENDENPIGIDAGTYQVYAKLNDPNNYTWSDGTTTDKTITCTIKKATPTLELDPNGNDSEEIGTKETKLTSNVNGTISLKSSNEKYVTTSIDNNKISKGEEKQIKINTLASRNTNTYVTITVTPNEEYSKNYTKGEIIYTVASIERKEVKKPKCNTNLVETGSDLTLVSENEAYTLYNNIGNSIGDYEVKVKLNYGYYWQEDNQDNKNTDDITITCTITKKATNTNKVHIYYTTNKGTLTTPTTSNGNNKYWKLSTENKIQISSDNITYKDYTTTITYGSNLGSAGLPNYNNTANLNITRKGYTATSKQEWICIEGDCKGKTYNHNLDYSDSDFCNAKDADCSVTLAVNWTITTITVTFYRNTSSTDKTKYTQTFTYGKENQKFNTGFTRTGYTALGWSKNKSATEKTWNFNANVSDNWIETNAPTITLYAVWTANTCTINYNANGGTFNKNANKTSKTIKYGDTINDMPNAKGGTYSATRTSEYTLLDADKAWIRTTNGVKIFSQDKGYSATDICPNLATGNQTVTLYVNWYKYLYSKKTCSACNSCSAAGCASSITTYDWYCCTNLACPSGNWYYNRSTNPFPNGYCTAKKTHTTCTSYYRSCSSCGCSNWGSWSDYTYSSCTESSSSQCRSTKKYVKNQS